MRRHEIRGLSVHKKRSFLVSKKASMQLSINAIVVLVMAIAILGLGLGIVRGIGNRANEFTDFPVDLTEQASSSKPVANVKDEYSWQLGNDNELAISFYNSQTSDCATTGAEIYVACDSITNGAEDADGGVIDAEVTFSYLQREVKVDASTPGTLKARVTPNGNPGTYACEIGASCGDEQISSAQTFITFS